MPKTPIYETPPGMTRDGKGSTMPDDTEARMLWARIEQRLFAGGHTKQEPPGTLCKVAITDISSALAAAREEGAREERELVERTHMALFGLLASSSAAIGAGHKVSVKKVLERVQKIYEPFAKRDRESARAIREGGSDE